MHKYRRARLHFFLGIVDRERYPVSLSDRHFDHPTGLSTLADEVDSKSFGGQCLLEITDYKVSLLVSGRELARIRELKILCQKLGRINVACRVLSFH